MTMAGSGLLRGGSPRIRSLRESLAFRLRFFLAAYDRCDRLQLFARFWVDQLYPLCIAACLPNFPDPRKNNGGFAGR